MLHVLVKQNIYIYSIEIKLLELLIFGDSNCHDNQRMVTLLFL